MDFFFLSRWIDDLVHEKAPVPGDARLFFLLILLRYGLSENCMLDASVAPIALVRHSIPPISCLVLVCLEVTVLG